MVIMALTDAADVTSAWRTAAILRPVATVGPNPRFGYNLAAAPPPAAGEPPRLLVAAPWDGDRGQVRSGSVYL